MNLLHMLIQLARRGLLAFCALFALLALLGTQALPVSAATTPSFIRLMNASPDVGTVDVFVDGAKFLGSARFARVTDYLQLPSGPHKVELALLGKGTGAAVMVQKLSVQAGAAYTVAASGTKATGLALQVFVDDNRMVSGMATVRVYDLSPQSGAVSVAAGTHTLIAPVSYRQASTYQSFAAGLYTFTFSSSQPAFTLVNQVTLKSDTVTSLFVVGVLHGTPSLVVIQVQVKGLPRLLAGTGSDPNALPVNASEFAPAPLIALPLGVLALAGIAVAWFTRFWPFSRQKGSSHLRPRQLFGAALGGILALVLSLGGLSFASFMTHPAPAPTARLLIPAIGVNAPIESVGVQANGAMDTPRQSPWSDVGLYTGGPRQGDRGSAVIAGHLDRPGGNPAVFWRLRELHVGDEVQFVNAQGQILLFHVTHIEAYPVQDAPVQAIFGNTTGRFLNLTTCTGDWIPTQHQRAMRLVVYTSFGPAPATTSPGLASAPLTLPSSSSSSTASPAAPSSSSPAAPSPAVPSSSSSSTASPVAPSSSSSSVSSAPTLTSLPVAIRPSVTVKLPGVSNQATSQVTSTPVLPTVQQASKQVTSTPVAQTAQQVSKQVTSTPVAQTVQQASKQVTSTPVAQTAQQVSKQVTSTPVAQTAQQVSKQVTSTPVAQTVQQVSKQVTSTPVAQTAQQVSKQVTSAPVLPTVQQVSKQVTSTPVAQTAQQVSKQV